MERQFSIKRAFLDLLFIKIQIKEIYKDYEKYKQLIEFMLSKDFLDYDEPIPSLKQIGIELNLKPHTLRKLIHDLYKDIFDVEKNNFLDFSNTEIYFDLSYFENDRGYFQCKNLKHLPRVGENITIPFLKAQVGTDYFYVERIRHTFDENIQRIDITLKSGFFNKYFHYQKHRAYELGMISLNDFFSKHDLSIRDQMDLK